MPNPPVHLTPSRLFQSSEAVLKTLADLMRQGVSCDAFPYLPDLIGTLDCPRGLSGFTRNEVFEGVMFLNRLGFISVQQTP